MDYLMKYRDEYKKLSAGNIAHMFYLYRYHNRPLKEALEMAKTMSFEELDKITHINDKFNIAIEGLDKYIFNGIDFPKMSDTYQALRGESDDIDWNRYLEYVGEQIKKIKCEDQNYIDYDFEVLLADKISLILNDLHNKIVSDGAKSIEEATSINYLYYSLPTFFVSIKDLHEEMCIMHAILIKFGYYFILIDDDKEHDWVYSTMFDAYVSKQFEFIYDTLHLRNDEQLIDYLKNIDKHYPSINVNKDNKEVMEARLKEYKKDDVIKELVKILYRKDDIDWNVLGFYKGK